MKRILLGTLAAAVLSASAAAQSDQKPTHAELVQHWAEAALDTQLKTMKTNLRLTADQETLWGPFEAAVKDGAKARVLALQKEQSDNLSPMDRNLAKADRIAQGQVAIETMVDAAKPLYASLDETQKHKFITLGRMLVPERGQFAKAIRRLH
jgi:LTXXQ motif family protein